MLRKGPSPSGPLPPVSNSRIFPYSLCCPHIASSELKAAKVYSLLCTVEEARKAVINIPGFYGNNYLIRLLPLISGIQMWGLSFLKATITDSLSGGISGQSRHPSPNLYHQPGCKQLCPHRQWPLSSAAQGLSMPPAPLNLPVALLSVTFPVSALLFLHDGFQKYLEMPTGASVTRESLLPSGFLPGRALCEPSLAWPSSGR